MTNDDREELLKSERLNAQIYLFVSDWANYQINIDVMDDNKIALVRKILDDVRATAYAVAVILISDPAVIAYNLMSYEEKIENATRSMTVYELPDSVVKPIVDSILDNKTGWLI